MPRHLLIQGYHTYIHTYTFIHSPFTHRGVKPWTLNLHTSYLHITTILEAWGKQNRGGHPTNRLIRTRRQKERRRKKKRKKGRKKRKRQKRKKKKRRTTLHSFLIHLSMRRYTWSLTFFSYRLIWYYYWIYNKRHQGLLCSSALYCAPFKGISCTRHWQAWAIYRPRQPSTCAKQKSRRGSQTKKLQLCVCVSLHIAANYVGRRVVQFGSVRFGLGLAWGPWV